MLKLTMSRVEQLNSGHFLSQHDQHVHHLHIGPTGQKIDHILLFDAFSWLIVVNREPCPKKLFNDSILLPIIPVAPMVEGGFK